MTAASSIMAAAARAGSIRATVQQRRVSARVLIVSRHDYRSRRRASVHFLAQAMAAQGHAVDFMSIGYSWLSRLRGDSRAFLHDRANRWETVDGVRAYLWRTAWHAIDMPIPEAQLGWLYRRWARERCDALDAAAAGADCIFIESGIAPILIDRLRAAAPRARIVYRAADLLSVAGVPAAIETALAQAADKLDLVVVVARAMAGHFSAFPCPTVFVPHGVDVDGLSARHASPYSGPRNIVTAGAMLFDPAVVEIAARAMPDYQFHLIGTGSRGPFPPNVTLHDAMPFERTLPFLQHADIGLAAYRRGPDPADYLVDSSLKLLQFNALGLPAVCPTFAVGDRPHRFGYDPGCRESIVAAFRAAATARHAPVATPDWDEIAQTLMEAALG